MQIFTAPLGVKLRRKKPKKLYIVVGVANLAATTAIMALTSSSGRNKAHNKGTKLAETERYLARHMRLTGVFPSPLRHAEIDAPTKRG